MACHSVSSRKINGPLKKNMQSVTLTSVVDRMSMSNLTHCSYCTASLHCSVPPHSTIVPLGLAGYSLLPLRDSVLVTGLTVYRIWYSSSNLTADRYTECLLPCQMLVIESGALYLLVQLIDLTLCARQSFAGYCWHYTCNIWTPIDSPFHSNGCGDFVFMLHLVSQIR